VDLWRNVCRGISLIKVLMQALMYFNLAWLLLHRLLAADAVALALGGIHERGERNAVSFWPLRILGAGSNVAFSAFFR